MGRSIFINGFSGISAQTEEALFNNEPLVYTSNIFHAVPANYKEIVPAMALRRMSKAIKMGITAAKNALLEANVNLPDAIITATGEGCKHDTEKFLETVLEQKEELLAPTSFIQSTHNTVGGQIALNLNCTGYNLTYTQEDISLESAFIDAMLLLEEDLDVNAVLVGSVDEVSPKITSFSYLNNFLKKEEIQNLELFDQNSAGTITSEGAFFFVLSAEKKINSDVEIVAISTFKEKEAINVSREIHKFLVTNNCLVEDLDIVLLGKNGDRNQDVIYEILEKGLFLNSNVLVYKHLVGDFNTVTGFAIWLACKIFKNNYIPNVLKLNTVSSQNPKLALLYNLSQDNTTHSLILVQKV